jgi:hypothetical protein
MYYCRCGCIVLCWRGGSFTDSEVGGIFGVPRENRMGRNSWRTEWSPEDGCVDRHYQVRNDGRDDTARLIKGTLHVSLVINVVCLCFIYVRVVKE